MFTFSQNACSRWCRIRSYERTILEAAQSQNPTQAIIHHTSLLNDDSFDEEINKLSEKELEAALPHMVAFTYSLIYTIRSFMVFGMYLNELIALARTNRKDADKHLFNAIRIDPTIVGCAIATQRISKAKLSNDSNFLKKLNSALKGKLGKKEAKNYQKIRIILQVLIDTNADKSLNDIDLKELFVHQLTLYADSQQTAEKNLRTFTYNFIKKKSII